MGKKDVKPRKMKKVMRFPSGARSKSFIRTPRKTPLRPKFWFSYTSSASPQQNLRARVSEDALEKFGRHQGGTILLRRSPPISGSFCLLSEFTPSGNFATRQTFQGLSVTLASKTSSSPVVTKFAQPPLDGCAVDMFIPWPAQVYGPQKYRCSGSAAAPRQSPMSISASTALSGFTKRKKLRL